MVPIGRPAVPRSGAEPDRPAPGLRLNQRTIQVADDSRDYWLAWAAGGAEPREAPMIIGLHRGGGSGRAMALETGLAQRGTAAGFTVVCPDGCDGRRGQDPDDVAFLQAVVRDVVALGAARRGPVVLAGLSSGAFFAEHLARHGLLEVAGLALVAGSAREPSRLARPRPAQEAMVLCVAGTLDPLVPYAGGQERGGPDRAQLLGLAPYWAEGASGAIVGIEDVAEDWAAANAAAVGAVPAAPESGIDTTSGVSGVQLPTTRFAWLTPGAQPVALYRIAGGGHGWPGAPRFMPQHLGGPVPSVPDATWLVLDLAVSSTGRQAGPVR